LLVWDKDSYTEKFLSLLPHTCVLQPILIHLTRPLLQKTFKIWVVVSLWLFSKDLIKLVLALPFLMLLWETRT
jgi:hypothetical protein